MQPSTMEMIYMTYIDTLNLLTLIFVSTAAMGMGMVYWAYLICSRDRAALTDMIEKQNKAILELIKSGATIDPYEDEQMVQLNEVNSEIIEEGLEEAITDLDADYGLQFDDVSNDADRAAYEEASREARLKKDPYADLMIDIENGYMDKYEI